MEEKKKKTIEMNRVISAILGFPIVALILIFGNKYVIDIALAIVALQSMKEYLSVTSQKASPVKWISYLSCILIVIIHIIPSQYLGIVEFLALPLLIFILFFQVIVTNMKTNIYFFRNMLYCILHNVHITNKRNGKWNMVNMVFTSSWMGNRYICIHDR